MPAKQDMANNYRNSPNKRSDKDYVDAMEILLDNGVRPSHSRAPDLILPHVYVGSILNAENYRVLQKIGITHVLNCAAYKGQKSYQGSPYEGLHIEYKEFPADDSEYYDMSQHFEESFQYLDKVKRKGGCALVHCAQGLNRSVAICVAYLMHHKSMTLLRAVKSVQNKRGSVLTNRGFQRQLVKFAKEYGYLDQPSELSAIIPLPPPKTDVVENHKYMDKDKPYIMCTFNGFTDKGPYTECKERTVSTGTSIFEDYLRRRKEH